MENKYLKIGSLVIASALAIALAVPALASPGSSWDWIPGTYKIDSAVGSQIEVTLGTDVHSILGWSSDNKQNVIIDMEDNMHFVVKYGDPVDNISSITIPWEDFESDNFFITTMTFYGYIDVHMWGHLHMEENGTGQLALQDDLIDVDVLVEVTGPGDAPPDDGYENVEYENYTIYTKMGDGTPDNAGSAYVEVTMYLEVYDGQSESEIGSAPDKLVTLELPMILTTGDVYIHVTDTTPYPAQTGFSLDCKSLSGTGKLTSPENGAATLVGAAGGLDVYSLAHKVVDLDTWTDFISVTTLVIPDNSHWTEV